jgi:hypothetical protein
MFYKTRVNRNEANPPLSGQTASIEFLSINPQ